LYLLKGTILWFNSKCSKGLSPQNQQTDQEESIASVTFILQGKFNFKDNRYTYIYCSLVKLCFGRCRR